MFARLMNLYGGIIVINIESIKSKIRSLAEKKNLKSQEALQILNLKILKNIT